MAYCSRCGNESREGDRFCTNCGAALVAATFDSELIKRKPRSFPVWLLLLPLCLLLVIGGLIFVVSRMKAVTLPERPVTEVTTAHTEPLLIPQDTAPADSMADLQKWWNGDWYGWWAVDTGTGEFVDWEGDWWDCLAQITLETSGRCTLLVWDEDLPKKDALARIYFTVKPEYGSGPMGGAVSESGFFLDMDVGQDDYLIDPAMYGLENFIGLDGFYEDESGSFTFHMYLRPWGQRWEDVEEGYENIPYDPEEMYPYYYESWYLPLVEKGRRMPSTFS